MAASKSAKKTGKASSKTNASAASKKKASAPRKSAKTVAKSGSKGSSPVKAAKRAPAKNRVPPTGVMHWEIQANDSKRLHRFYSDLFGWKIDDGNPMKYGMVASKGKGGINGGIGGAPSGRSRVLVYANVADISATLERAERLGAKTIMWRTDMGPIVMGVFEDLEGNHFGVIEDPAT